VILRGFSRGEFPAGFYPKPRVGGVAPSAWQVDVKTTWPDGSVQTAYVSLPVTLAANGNVRIDFVKDAGACHLGTLATCQAAALTRAQMLAFDTGGGSGSWDFWIQATAGGISNTVKAKTMLSDWDGTSTSDIGIRYWLHGPVVTRIILEDTSNPTPAYDFGWQYSSSTWIAPSSNIYKSIHPIFVVSFYPGWSGVEAEVLAQNAWTTRLQSIVCDLVISSGASGGTTIYSKTDFGMYARTMLSRYGWSGTATSAVQIDHNLPYMVSTRLLPPYDYRLVPPMTNATGLLSDYAYYLGSDDPQSCSSTSNCGNISKYMPGAGGRPDIALVPGWLVHYLYAMGDTTTWPAVADRLNLFTKLVLGNTEGAVRMPMYLRELDTTYRTSPSYGQRYFFNYPQDAATPAFGRVASVSARPFYWAGEDQRYLTTNDSVYYVCSSGTCDANVGVNVSSWTMDTQHIPSTFAVPYLLTGRYAYLLAQQAYASWATLAWYARGCSNDVPRCYDMGIVWPSGSDFRAAAWSLREIYLAALYSPDGSPEKAYFAHLLANNEAVAEGLQNVTSGNAQPGGNCTTPADDTSNGLVYGGSRTESWPADGSGYLKTENPDGVKTSFALLGYPRSLSSVTVNSVAKTFGLKGTSGKDFYYSPADTVVVQDSSATALPSGTALNISYQLGTFKSPWCAGRMLMRFGVNPLGYATSPYSESLGGTLTGDGVNPANTLVRFQPYMWYYGLATMGWIERTGALVGPTGKPYFYWANRALASFAIGHVLNGNPLLVQATRYRMPAVLISNDATKDARLPGTWADHKAQFLWTAALVSAIDATTTTVIVDRSINNAQPLGRYNSTIRIGSEWMHICTFTEDSPVSGETTIYLCSGSANGRGRWGSTAAAHAAGETVYFDRQEFDGQYADGGHTYQNILADVIALMEPVTVAEGSATAAWERIYSQLRGLDSRASANTDKTAEDWAMVPYERVADVRVETGVVGQLTLRWVAPSGAACRVYVGATDPASSDDSSDTAANNSAGREQRYVWTGAAGTKQYRIACGVARVWGSASVQ
jgi:hypothetical protein